MDEARRAAAELSGTQLGLMTELPAWVLDQQVEETKEVRGGEVGGEVS